MVKAMNFFGKIFERKIGRAQLLLSRRVAQLVYEFFARVSHATAQRELRPPKRR